MYKQIELHYSDGSLRSTPFKATATTSIRYKQFAKKELNRCITGIINLVKTESYQELMKLTEVNENGERVMKEINLGDMSEGARDTMIALLNSEEIEDLKKIAYVMYKQGTGSDMTTLNNDDYLDWLDNYEPMEFINIIGDIIELYFGNVNMSVESKKK